MEIGHRPTRKPMPGRWLLDAPILAGGTVERSRLLVDESTGAIAARGAIDGKPNLILDDDLLVMPGFLDIHVHCRDDASESEAYKEDFTTASRAALHGGVVLLGDMPNNPRPPIDDASYREKKDRAELRSLVDVVPYAGVTAGGRPIAEAAPYKCYFGPSVGPLALPRGVSAEEVLAPYRGRLVAFHAESPAVLERARGAASHEDRRPAEAEAEAIAEIAALARRLAFRAHIAHLSSAAGLEEVRKARRSGVALSCEVAPHHLFFDRENRARFQRGEWLQMNPPLRTPRDREALRAAFESGEIEMLASDHAPHSLDENRRGISGVPQLDTFGAFLTLLASDGMSWETLVERAAAAPARLFASFVTGLFGRLEPGSAASFAVLAPRRPWRVAAGDLSTRSGWSPFEGFEFPGCVAMTAVRGKLYVMQ